MPFVLEGGRFGDHALASLLSEIAEFGGQTGKLKAPQSWSCSSPKAAYSLLLTGCASGSRRSLDGFRSPCLTLFFAIRHLVARASVYGS